MVPTKEVIDRLRCFFAANHRGYELGDAEPIFELDFVNSLFALQLVEFIEEELEIEIDEEDLEISNFRSLVAIADFGARKGAQGSATPAASSAASA